MPTRRYFRKAVAPVPKPPKAPKPPKPPALSIAVSTTALGRRTIRTVNTGRALMAMGRRKGALKMAEEGTAHRWDSETARKAALKSWKSRRMNKRIGARVGLKAARKKPLWRAPLREYYAEHPTKGIWFDHDCHCWWRRVSGEPYVISERQALNVLGHLCERGTFVPDSITPIHRGKKDAGTPRQVRLMIGIRPGGLK